MKTILTLTLNPCIDISSHVVQILPEDKLRCTNVQYDPGGGGINVSRVIKTLGGSSIALYCRGGATGNLLDELLERDSLEKKSVKIKGNTRQNTTIFEEKSQSQYRFVMPGPNLFKSEWRECIDFILELSPMPSYIVVSGALPPGVPLSFISELVNDLKGTDTRLIFDTSGEALKIAAKEKVYLLKPNLKEFSDLLNRDQIDDHDLEACSKEFIAKGFCEILILSLGDKGAIFASSNEIKRIYAPEVKAVSKIGAGDSLVGAMVFGLMNDYTPYDSALLAVAAGSAAVMSEGTQLCLANNVWRLFEEIKEGER